MIVVSVKPLLINRPSPNYPQLFHNFFTRSAQYMDVAGVALYQWLWCMVVVG